jgi:hypothetical protein
MWYLDIIESVFQGNDYVNMNFMEIKGVDKYNWPKHNNFLSVPVIDVLYVVATPMTGQCLWVLSKADYDNAMTSFDKWEVEEDY